ncbi:MAG TPA: hypothetical protein VKX16_19560 [Chloroflexota bacterium]|nr:hypothetical protein [Chloroflexota bacterium]
MTHRILAAGLLLTAGLGSLAGSTPTTQAATGPRSCVGPTLVSQHIIPGPPEQLEQQWQDASPITLVKVVKLKNGTESDNAPGNTVTVYLTKTNQSKPTHYNLRVYAQCGAFSQARGEF